MAASSRVVVVGADIIYRQNIFDPLLGTLKLLFATSKVSRCMIATQSIRQHLEEFWTKAASAGFRRHHVANVQVPDDGATEQMRQDGRGNQLPQVSAPSKETGPGIIHILDVVFVESSPKT